MRSFSYRGRLMVAMAALIVVISVAMAVYLPRILEREAIALVANKADSVARLTAFTIHPAIYFQDRAALDEALSGARRDTDVAYIIVTDPAGQRLAAYHPERATGDSGLSDDGTLYEVTLPIRDGARHMATLSLGLTLGRLRREIADMRVAVGIIITLISAAGLLAVYLIAKRDASLRRMSKRLLSVQEEERIRIAREVHDELGQALTSLKIDLQQTGGREVARKIDQIVELVRRIAFDLRPAILDDLGITAALEQQLRRLRESTGIATTLHVAEEPQLDPLTRVTLYRIAQEALSNVIRHAGATEVEVSLGVEEGTATLEIRDNGRGIAKEQINSPRSLGLIGIRERAELLGGDVSIDGAGGTTLRVTLPVGGNDRHVASAVR